MSSSSKQFTCPVSMAVTEEQFNNDLRQPLIDLGYTINFLDSFINSPILVTNYRKNHNECSNSTIFWAIENSRHFIDTYNPQLFLTLASLTTESVETKEEVLARFENKIEERELIGYRFRNNYYNVMTYSLINSEYGLYEEMKSQCNLNCNIIKTDYTIINKLTELNLLDTFCEPVYKEIETISIEEAESILRSIGRTEKIKA